MSAIHQLLTDHIDVWTGADTEKKSGRGRASGNAASVYGIKKLRELILELAVRGKLVPQDFETNANDEFQVLNEQKTLLQETEKFKPLDQSNLPIPKLDLSIPTNWKVCRLDDIAAIARGGSPRPIKSFITDNNDNSGFNWIKIGDSERGSIYINSTEEKIKKSGVSSSRIVYPDDLILSNSMSFGYPYILNITGCIHDGWLVIRTPKSLISKLFLYYLFRSTYVFESFKRLAAGAVVQNLNADKVKELIIGLPPLAEQHRIVAKVDELMALCDQLETQHSNAAIAHEHLVSHLLGTLTQSQSADDFQVSWQRIAAHFDTLFTTEASIDALKQTLLQLAVMGKLVPQDASDEPASELLKRIQAEKAKLVAEGKIKKDKPLAVIGVDEKPFELPESWEWVRFGSVIENSGAGWSPSCEGHPRIENEWGVLKVSAVSWGQFQPNENKALPLALEPRMECVVESGDFLVSRANTAELVARSVVVENCPPNLMMSDKIVRLRLSKFCNSHFMNLANLSQFARNYYSRVAGGTSSSMKNVSREQILNLLIPQPPLAEQHRIVAKVDELMALCDQLKSRLTAVNQLKQKIADVLVEQAVA